MCELNEFNEVEIPKFNIKKMLKDWLQKQIGEIAKVTAGGTPKTSQTEYWIGGNIPWLSSGEIHKKRVKNTDNYISVLGLKESSAKLLPSQTILMALAGQGKTRGTVAITEIELSTNQSVAGIIVNKKVIFPYFLYHNLNNRYKELRSLSTGSGRAGLNLEIIKNISVLLPPLPEQQKIAAILSSVDDVIEKTRTQIAKLRDLKTAMMQELFTRGIGHTEFKDSPVGRIPQEWEVSPLGTKVSLIPGYAFKSSDFVAEGIPLIRMGNLYQNSLNLNRSPVYLPENFIDKYKKFSLVPGDIVFSMTGTSGKEDYGFAVQLPENAPTCLLNQRVAKIASSVKVDVRFLINLLRSRLFLDTIYALGTGTKQANLSSSQILSIMLPFPCLLEQKVIGKSLLSLDSTLRCKEKKLSTLNSLKNALMQALLTGKIRVNVA